MGAPGLFAGLEVGYLSSRQTLAGSSVGGAAVANLTFFQQRIARGLDLSASVYNLFGTRYSDPASEEFRQDSIAQDGRTARVWLTIHVPAHELSDGVDGEAGGAAPSVGAQSPGC